MDCLKFAQMLDNYSNLTEAQVSELELHAAECEDCRKELEFFRMIADTTSSLASPSPPPDLISRINSRIDSGPRSRTLDSVIANIRSNIRQYAMAAACLVVGIVVGVNGKMLSDRISGTDNDGVISQQTAETRTDTGSENTANAGSPAQTEATPFAEPEAAVPADRADAGSGAVSDAGGAEAKNAEPHRTDETIPRRTDETAVRTNTSGRRIEQNSSAAGNESSASVSTAAPEAYTQASAGSEAVQPEQETAAVQAEEAVTETHQTQQPDIEANDNTYTIPSDTYHMPDEAQTAYAAQANEEDNGVENYALAEDSAGSVYGYSEEKIPDQLAFDQSYVDAVANIINELNIKNNGEACIASSDEFDSLLVRMSLEGISYNYIPRGSSDGVIVFRLVLR